MNEGRTYSATLTGRGCTGIPNGLYEFLRPDVSSSSPGWTILNFEARGSSLEWLFGYTFLIR